MSRSEEEKLNDIRTRIDAIDEQIQGLITERALQAKEVAKIKEESGSDVFYRPEREAQILGRIKERNAGVLEDNTMARLFREIISACLALEKVLEISYLGPEGTYTHTAAVKHFGHAVKTRPATAIDEVFRDVESGAANYGVVPIENSTEGMVNHTLDMFVRSPLKICGEVELRIHHQLLSRVSEIRDINVIYSHQQSFAQCREWLNANMAGIEHRVVSSNGRAAELAAKESGTAAIAGDTAAELYQLSILARNIEDEPQNTTRFLVIGKQETRPSGRDKTSLMLSAGNKPGSLYSVLQPMKKHGINMTRIESRPSKRGIWDYVFFVDIEGHCEDPKIQAALEDLRKATSMIKILGSYPQVVF
ncbi:MAG: prephenate dehydratase [Gammaproteobacteria bacterium]|nr:prephenate dehydratase [Gammaproteobacteria bacterium]